MHQQIIKYKRPFVTSVILFIALSLNAQKLESNLPDSLTSNSLELYRNVFWNNIPKPLNWTNDYENIYTDEEQTQLNNLILAFEKETSIEIAIVTLDTIKTSAEKFNSLSLHIANTWKIGKAEKNNGILIAISAGYRKIKIHTGDGISDRMSEYDTKEILQNYFLPAFKNGEYYAGTMNGLNQIIKLLKTSPNINKFNYHKDSLILKLPEMNNDTLDCEADIYWKIIKRGKASIPFLIESITDTTLTNIYDYCKKGKLTVGEVSYFALNEIAEFPEFSVTHIQFDVVENGCWNFFDYLFNTKNKPEFQKMVRSFYHSNTYEYYEFKQTELTECYKKYGILGKYKLKR